MQRVPDGQRMEGRRRKLVLLMGSRCLSLGLPRRGSSTNLSVRSPALATAALPHPLPFLLSFS